METKELFDIFEKEVGNLHMSNVILQRELRKAQEEIARLTELFVPAPLPPDTSVDA